MPEATPNSHQAITTLINDQTTFNGADDTFLNGVMCFCPVIPLTKCGTAFNAKKPAKKYQIKFILYHLLKVMVTLFMMHTKFNQCQTIL